MFNFFRRRKNRPVPHPREVTGEALRAVPRKSPVVEEKVDPETEKLYLRIEVAPRNPLSRAIQRKTAWKRYRQFDLDPVGREFWELCNGCRTLATIEKALRRNHGWTPQDCRQAVVQYTMALTQRNLLLLDLSHRLQPQEEE